MPASVGGGEPYPDHGFSVPQLLAAAKRKLLGSGFGGRIPATMNQAEVDVLERDALEVLGLVGTMKNNFAPINRIPSDIFYLIPGYLEDVNMDGNLITMTHVCRGWRELLVACSSLWTRLNCKNTDKTRIYIERSKSSPLNISLSRHSVSTYPEDAFLSVVPHISRLKSLTIDGTVDPLQNLTPHLSCPIPLLRELTINLVCNPAPVLNNALFDGDLSSLRLLCLTGVITHLPWKNMSKLTTFILSNVPGGNISTTQLLDFLMNAPHLRDIIFDRSIPTPSNALPRRVVSLPCLKNLTIFADHGQPTLLNHLSIPAGASLDVEFEFHGNKSPLPELLPKVPGNLKNVSSITSVNLCLGALYKFLRLYAQVGGSTYLATGRIGMRAPRPTWTIELSGP